MQKNNTKNDVIPYLEASFICISDHCLLLSSRTAYDKNFYSWLYIFSFFLTLPTPLWMSYQVFIQFTNNIQPVLYLSIMFFFIWLTFPFFPFLAGWIGSSQLRHLSPIIFNRKTQKIYMINMKGEEIILPWKEVEMQSKIHNSSTGGSQILESVLDIEGIGDIRTPVSYTLGRGTASEQAREFIRVFMEEGPDDLPISMPEGYALENQKHYSFDLNILFQHLSIWPIYNPKDKVYDYLMHKAVVRWPFRVFFFALYIATHMTWRWFVKRERQYPKGAFDGCDNEIAVTKWDVYQHITENDYNELTENYLDLPYKELRKRMKNSGLPEYSLHNQNHGVYREAKTPSFLQNSLSLLISLGLMGLFLWWVMSL